MTILELYYEDCYLTLQVWEIYFFICLCPRKMKLILDAERNPVNWYVQLGLIGCWGVL